MKKGFTLVEVLITVVVLTVGMIAIHQGFSRCLTGFKASEQSLYGTLLLERSAISFQMKLWDKAEPSKEFKPQVELPDGYEFQFEKTPFEFRKLQLDQYALTVETPNGEKIKSTMVLPREEEK